MTFNRSAWSMVVCCGIVASAGTALAQDAGGAAAPAPPPADGTAPPPDGAAAQPAPPAPPAEAPAARWPRAVIARPLTLPGGVAQVGADFNANHDFSALRLTAVAGYGVNDSLELNGFYNFPLKDFDIKGVFDLDVGYKLLRGSMDGALEVIGRARIGYDASAQGASPYGLADKGASPLRLGVQVAYVPNPKNPKLVFLTPGQQVVIGLSEDGGMAKPTYLQLPIQIGFQATPELYLQLDTTLLQIKIADSANAFIGADTTPVALTATYNAIQALDVIASVGLNLTPPSTTDPVTMMSITPGVGDTLVFLLGARYYIGKL
jgi:hypothetical protein